MSRPPQQQQQRPVNMFKQMEKGNAASVAQRQGNTIKEALLKWCQNKVRNFCATLKKKTTGTRLPHRHRQFLLIVGERTRLLRVNSSLLPGRVRLLQIERERSRAQSAPRLHHCRVSVLEEQTQQHIVSCRQRAGIMPLLEIDDMLMMGDRPDWKCIFTYVQTFYTRFRDVE